MWRSRAVRYWAASLGTIAVLALAAWFGPTLYTHARVQIALSGCSGEKNADIQVECVFRIIDAELHRGGVAAAFYVFTQAYEKFQNFADGGCHSRAHRVGDLTYYELYLGNETLNDLDFPQDSTACGYGFFHGFLEHYIQDRPTVAQSTQICDYFISHLAARMGDIELICYHGAGHGFTLAQSEKIKRSDWGHVAPFTAFPSSQCRALPKANATDIEQCYEGIYNIIVDYMETKQYGFTYDTEHPFAICFEQKQEEQQACIYEMAQKLDAVSGYNPSKMIDIVRAIPNGPNRLMAFEVGIGGVMQQIVATTDGYQKALDSCSAIEDPYYALCVKSIAWGLYEHGDPQQEYKKVLAFCAEPSIAERGMAKLCYESAANRLPRFYDNATISSICLDFPEEYRTLCTNQLSVVRQGTQAPPMKGR